MIPHTPAEIATGLDMARSTFARARRRLAEERARKDQFGNMLGGLDPHRVRLLALRGDVEEAKKALRYWQERSA